MIAEQSMAAEAIKFVFEKDGESIYVVLRQEDDVSKQAWPNKYCFDEIQQEL